MTATVAPDLLQRHARRVRTSRTAAWLMASVAAATALLSWASRAGWNPWYAALPGAIVLGVGALLIRRRPVTADTIASHVNRTVPSAEESAALLLSADDTAIARLQRRRVREALAIAPVPPLRSTTLPWAFAVASAAAVVTVAAFMVPAATAVPITATPPQSAAAAVIPLAITGTALQWTPPRYTGHAARVAATRNVTIEEGSTARWSVAAPAADFVYIVTSTGDTLRTTATDSGWTATTTIVRPVLWHVEAFRDSSIVRGPDRLISVLPDQPPLLSVITPPSRTSLEWRDPHQVVVRALVSDDYALGAMSLVALVGGRGEGVKFRERRFTVEIESRRGPASVIVTRKIDLDSLEARPGDEVLIAFEAYDRREPTPQSARSETIFITMLDTLGVSQATLPGISLRVEPAYFRSQRQIILDTEALLRDIRLGNGGDVMRRSMEIGYEQHLLRIRYGELVGDETEGEAGAPVDDDHVITADDFRHNHDMAENATLLSASVKSLLKGALAQMWEAEKQLRTGNPRAALPSEYRALESLEEIRRASRAYVKRIGFEPPAIDVAATRLTKRATGLAGLNGAGALAIDDPDAPLRDALALLDRPGAARDAALTASGERLAQRAVDDSPGALLETLGTLRAVLDGCESCVPALRRGLLAALPAPAPPIMRRPAPRGQ